MAIFKIIGRIARTVSDDAGNRVERVYDAQYRLIRVAGNKPAGIHPDVYKNGIIRSISRMARTIGFVESEYQSAFICNDSAINSPESLSQLPSFNGYSESDNFDLA